MLIERGARGINLIKIILIIPAPLSIPQYCGMERGRG
jgi:hypothetical protein